jgi:hypothetical protein
MNTGGYETEGRLYESHKGRPENKNRTQRRQRNGKNLIGLGPPERAVIPPKTILIIKFRPMRVV